LKNTWLFPVIQSLHVVGVGLFVGLISLRDWKATRGVAQATRSMNAALLVTGFALFAADSTRYLSNSAFLLKLALVAAALLFEYLIRPRWETRVSAILSLTLWSAVVISSRLIEDFDK
jgi:hypothetical protein